MSFQICVNLGKLMGCSRDINAIVDSPEREVGNGRISTWVCTLSSSIQLSSSQQSYAPYHMHLQLYEELVACGDFFLVYSFNLAPCRVLVYNQPYRPK